MYIVLPTAVVAVAAALGALALGGERWLGAIRLVAGVSVVVVVALALLPEAYAELGVGALVAAFGGLLVPAFFERLSRGFGELAPAWTLAALAAHQAVDGAQVAWLGPEIGVGAAAFIALHGAVLVAAAVMASADRGRRATVQAGVILTLATLAGALVGSLAGGSLPAGADGWVRAIVAGVLIHVLVHDGLMHASGREHPHRDAS